MLLAAGAIIAAGLGGASDRQCPPAVPGIPGVPGVPQAPANPAKYSAIALSSETGVGELGQCRFLQRGQRRCAHACQNAAATTACSPVTPSTSVVALAVDAVNFEQWHSGLGPSVVSSQTAALNATAAVASPRGLHERHGPNRAFTACESTGLLNDHTTDSARHSSRWRVESCLGVRQRHSTVRDRHV